MYMQSGATFSPYHRMPPTFLVLLARPLPSSPNHAQVQHSFHPGRGRGSEREARGRGPYDMESSICATMSGVLGLCRRLRTAPANIT